MARFTLAALAVGLVAIVSAPGSALDKGLDRTGGSDAGADLSASLAAASARGAGAEIPGGLYRIDRWIDPGLNQTIAVRDAKFSGTGGINSPDWSPYLAGVGAGWIRRTDKPGTEFGIVSSYTVESSGKAPSYQKGAAYFSARQYDPSDYKVDGKPSDQLRDLVGLQTSCEIANGNLRGRCWGGASYAIGKSGSRGTLIGWESDVFKYDGVDQPLSDHFDTSIGILSVAFGGKATTAFAASAAEGGNWYHGFTTRQGEVLNTAFGVQKAGQVDVWNWRVTPDGKMVSQDITAASVTSNGNLVAGGNASIAGKVGFNGAAPAEKCSLDAALPTNGRASNAALASALNKVRSCLMTLGLAR
ncbi:hypothetical protein SAMN04487843_14421 [Methylobacterium sp. ap11]|uniref:hypothetical protein n=1 Tax=Methylobacterium sp. ap11 TaxID=1761799 RepID=UPI0008CDF259|nr:hypothetical protein [Methylobacterium sp. ap11]SEP51114.1 hypothetical protein SAMN04487843_14421 [Methylobacterium sp. ap11]